MKPVRQYILVQEDDVSKHRLTTPFKFATIPEHSPPSISRDSCIQTSRQIDGYIKTASQARQVNAHHLLVFIVPFILFVRVRTSRLCFGLEQLGAGGCPVGRSVDWLLHGLAIGSFVGQSVGATILTPGRNGSSRRAWSVATGGKHHPDPPGTAGTMPVDVEISVSDHL